MGELTEANYQSRRISRVRQIAEAREAYNTAAFGLELDQSTEAEVTAAKAQLDMLEGRLAGLDAAWAARTKQLASEHEIAEQAACKTAAASVDRLLKARARIGVKLGEAAAMLAEAYGDFEKNGRLIVEAVAPVASHLGRDGIYNLRDEATGSFGSPAFLVAGLLKDGGLDFSGIDTREASFRLKEKGLDTFIEQHSDVIRRRVRDLSREIEA